MPKFLLLKKTIIFFLKNVSHGRLTADLVLQPTVCFRRRKLTHPEYLSAVKLNGGDKVSSKAHVRILLANVGCVTQQASAMPDARTCKIFLLPFFLSLFPVKM